MNILVIGNGFDLAHGLKTKYQDFLDYCQNIIKNNSNKDNKKLVAFCNTNLWLKHFINQQKKLGRNWIDLEKEIFSILTHLNTFSYNFSNNYKQYVNYNSPEFSLKIISKELLTEEELSKRSMFDDEKYYEMPSNLKDFIQDLYDQLRQFTECFEYYLDHIVMEKLNTKTTNFQLNLNGNYGPSVALNFNYTNTLELLYNNMIGVIYYPHGQIRKNNLILGTESFQNTKHKDDNSTILPVHFNIFRKHNQRHKHNTIEAYQNLLYKIKHQPYNPTNIFHIIGHSLDSSDHNILKYLFLSDTDAYINIYYHNAEAQEHLINNITQIIGEEEVMKRVRLIEQHNEERSILRPINTP